MYSKTANMCRSPNTTAFKELSRSSASISAIGLYLPAAWDEYRPMSENPKTVVLTGASRRIGHATVMRFSHEGWRIITCSRDEVPDACQRDPNWAIHIPTDLADEASVKAFIEQANDVIGDAPLNALVNNAAVSPKTPFKERLGCLNGDIDGWRQVYDLESVRADHAMPRLCGCRLRSRR